MENLVNKKYTNEIDLSYLDELNKHYLKRDSINYIENNNMPLYSKYGNNRYILDSNDYEKNKEKKYEKKSNIINKFKIGFMTRMVISLILFIVVLCYKYYPDSIKNTRIVTAIKKEYNKNYSKLEILENAEEICKKGYQKINNIIPEKIYLGVVNKYVNSIKPKIIDTNLDNFFKGEEITVAVFNEESFKINDTEYTPIEEAIAVNSEVSLMAMDAQEILQKNINIVQPVYGTITSQYGAREEILDVVGYHTGIDIANSYNTEIKSATDGKVVKAENNNYYYGNNIEIENNGVIFKYAHMNKLFVSEGDGVYQNQVIGLMGATGQATGSHLHFEIRINGRTVDPEMVIEFK